MDFVRFVDFVVGADVVLDIVVPVRVAVDIAVVALGQRVPIVRKETVSHKDN